MRLGRIRKHLPPVVGVLSLAFWLAVVAAASHDVPRCPDGLIALGARCCGEGQTLAKGACVGRPTRCPAGFELRVAADVPDRQLGSGCVIVEDRVKVRGGESSWRPPDTNAGTPGERATTGFFIIDKVEVTWARWKGCVDEKACPTIVPLAGGDPGQAVHGVTLFEARQFCAWAGGRLPMDAEWLRVAIGDHETRYPWGDPDALCMRATYGLVNGPCAIDGLGPDTVGARPSGETPAGVLDVAGNVAEWIDDGVPAPSASSPVTSNALGVVRGGSFADSDATPLRARHRRVIDATQRHVWVGFRCAYDGTDEMMP